MSKGNNEKYNIKREDVTADWVLNLVSALEGSEEELKKQAIEILEEALEIFEDKHCLKVMLILPLLYMF